MAIIPTILVCLCFPSIDEEYYQRIRCDPNDSASEKSLNQTDDCVTCDETASIDTCFLLLDKPGYSLYSQGFNQDVYGEIVDDVVKEFSKPGNINVSNISDKHNFSFQVSTDVNCISDYSSLSYQIDSEEEDIDSEMLPSLESEWDIHEMGQLNLNQKEQTTLLQDYLNQDKTKKREMQKQETPGNKSTNPYSVFTPEVKRLMMNLDTQQMRK